MYWISSLTIWCKLIKKFTKFYSSPPSLEFDEIPVKTKNHVEFEDQKGELVKLQKKIRLQIFTQSLRWWRRWGSEKTFSIIVGFSNIETIIVLDFSSERLLCDVFVLDAVCDVNLLGVKVKDRV